MEQNKAQDVQEAAKEYAKREACNGSIPDMVASMIKLEQAVLYGASLTSRQLPSVEECVEKAEKEFGYFLDGEYCFSEKELTQLIHFSQGKTK